MVRFSFVEMSNFSACQMDPDTRTPWNSSRFLAATANLSTWVRRPKGALIEARWRPAAAAAHQVSFVCSLFGSRSHHLIVHCVWEMEAKSPCSSNYDPFHVQFPSFQVHANSLRILFFVPLWKINFSYARQSTGDIISSPHFEKTS